MGTPKTEASNCPVKLFSNHIAALQTHRNRQIDEGLGTSELGMLRRQNVYRRSFNPLIHQAGVPDIAVHDLRHAHARMMAESGVAATAMKARLGHTSISTNMKYVYATARMQY
jgi:site-specific recombinase XerD